jgi:hypothetical protein
MWRRSCLKALAKMAKTNVSENGDEEEEEMSKKMKLIGGERQRWAGGGESSWKTGGGGWRRRKQRKSECGEIWRKWRAYGGVETGKARKENKLFWRRKLAASAKAGSGRRNKRKSLGGKLRCGAKRHRRRNERKLSSMASAKWLWRIS